MALPSGVKIGIGSLVALVVIGGIAQGRRYLVTPATSNGSGLSAHHRRASINPPRFAASIGGGGDATPTPTPTATPAASPSATPTATPTPTTGPSNTPTPASAISPIPVTSAQPAATPSVGTPAIEPLPPETTSTVITPTASPAPQAQVSNFQIVRAAALAPTSRAAVAAKPTSPNAIVFTGQSSFDITLTIHSDIQVVHPVRDADGYWSYSIDSLENGTHTATIRGIDPISNTEVSATKSFLVDTAQAASTIQPVGPAIKPDPFVLIPPMYGALFGIMLLLGLISAWVIYRYQMSREKV